MLCCMQQLCPLDWSVGKLVNFLKVWGIYPSMLPSEDLWERYANHTYIDAYIFLTVDSFENYTYVMYTKYIIRINGQQRSALSRLVT